MTHKIDENRLNSYMLKIGKNEFPIFQVNPKNPSKKLIFFVPGLNGNGNMIYYWDYKVFDNAYFVSYDARSQATNLLKAKMSKNIYIDDLYKVIIAVKQRLNIEEIYLLGESWGSAISFLLMKKHPDLIKGTFCWNMPYGVNDVNKIKGREKVVRNLKVVLTFFLNIDTYDHQPFGEGLINNNLISRSIKMSQKKNLSNKLIIASWLSFKPAWRFIMKNYEHLNFHYIQSQNDLLGDIPLTKKFASKSDKFCYYPNGHHILSFDVEMCNQLFDDMHKFIFGPTKK